MPAAPAPADPFAAGEGPASFALGAVSGFVDTAGFILLAGVFTAHVTGNLVLVGAALAGGGGGDAWARLLLLPVFMAAVVLASALAQAAVRRGGRDTALVLAGEALALAAFLAAGLARDGGAAQPPGAADLFVIGAPAVVAMGFQNALMREGLKTFLPTTMMTGNVTQFTLDLAARLRGAGTPAVAARLRRVGIVLGGFLVGAAAGAAGAAWWRFACVTVPLAVVLALAVRAARAPAAPPTLSP